MIQRVQSLFLLGVAICMLLALVFPIWEKDYIENDKKLQIYALYSKEVQPDNGETIEEYFPYALAGIFGIMAAVVALVEIFKYKNRLTQIKLGALNSLLMSAFLGIALYLTFQSEKIVAPGNQGDYELGLFLPCIALILNVLANRFIRKDERLVRSVDRIR